MTGENSLFNMVFLFWVILDPLGNIPIYVSQLKEFDAAHQKRIILRELLISLFVMIVFLFFGQGFFSLMQIKQPTLQIAGGTILFILALRMIFSIPRKNSEKSKAKEPLIVPLAIPAVAGPGILATITLYGGKADVGQMKVLLAIIIAWLLSFPFLFYSPYLKKVLGENGIIATEKLFGYLIILISVQMAVNGFTAAFIHN